MRKFAVLAVLLILTGCGQGDPKPKKSIPYDAPRDRMFPNNTPNPLAPSGLQSPPAAPKNKEAFADPKRAVFKVLTYGAFSGKVEFDAEYFPLPNPKNDRIEWERTIVVEPNKIIEASVIPDSSTVWSMCVWYRHNKILNYQIAPTGGCTSTFIP